MTVPTLVFAGADSISGLGPALIAAVVSGVLIPGWHLRAGSQKFHRSGNLEEFSPLLEWIAVLWQTEGC
jgi:hypothetical protein